ncbi:DNA mismatch repair endonuclease MutL [Glaciecola sp. SC05]|uniref:DNA mismatch repair endonuclease MutL n=1 Tax=Glaciecola sp. SC05 TaxID=1987355 RepID=UPI003527889B
MSDDSYIASKIQLLPPQLANQIAAGEVVERPASVVKELIENSIDAKADSIHVEIEQGGHKRILIRDSGSGIAQDQLVLALSRHATSKIRDIDDLECINSMGFRGEALASISSVSRLTLTSRPQDQAQAWQAKAQGIDMDVTLSPAAHPHGTSIEVIDLFFNTPARRKFLRAQKTEFQHIETIVRRIALAHPNIAFSLTHNGKLVHKWRAGDLISRVKAVCGAAYLQQSTAINYQHENMRLTGWCSKIGEGWPTTEQQYIFVNCRMIRDKLVLHAIRQAYEGMLPDNQYPAYVLFLSLPPQDMDINVHPAKHEVRFHHARQVHDVIFQAISQAIVSAQALAEQGQLDKQDVTSSTPESFSLSARSSEQSVGHDYIRPLQADKAATHSAHLADTASPRLNSTSASAVTRGRNTTHFHPSAQANIAEAGKLYQELMQNDTSASGNTQYVRLGSYLLLQQNEDVIALPLVKIIALGFEIEIANASTSQPLLMPVSVCQKAVLQKTVLSQLQAIGCIIESRHQKYILKQVPSAIRALPWAHIFARILEQTTALSSESECIELIAQYYLEIAQLSPQSIQSMISRLDSKRLDDAIKVGGHKLSEQTLVSTMERK